MRDKNTYAVGREKRGRQGQDSQLTWGRSGVGEALLHSFPFIHCSCSSPNLHSTSRELDRTTTGDSTFCDCGIHACLILRVDYFPCDRSHSHYHHYHYRNADWFSSSTPSSSQDDNDKGHREYRCYCCQRIHVANTGCIGFSSRRFVASPDQVQIIPAQCPQSGQ